MFFNAAASPYITRIQFLPPDWIYRSIRIMMVSLLAMSKFQLEGRLRRISQDLPQETRNRLHYALAQPHVDYCCVVWDCC